MRIHSSPQITIRFLRKCLSGMILLELLCTSLSFAQSVGDFRSRQSGNWNQNNTWEEFTGAGWQNTNQQPKLNSGLVTIRAPHNIVGNKKGTFDELLIEFGAELLTTQVMKISDGPGIDLEVFGDLIVDRVFRILGTSSAFFHGSSYTEIRTGQKIRFEGTSTATFDGATILDDGTFQSEDDSVVLLQGGTVLTIENKINMRDNAVMTITQSTIINQSTSNVNNSASAVFDDGGLYIHDRNGEIFLLE